MSDWFECCHHCKKSIKGIGCHGKCPDYKKATIKNELQKRKERREKEKEEAFFSYCGFSTSQKRIFKKSKIKELEFLKLKKIKKAL